MTLHEEYLTEKAPPAVERRRRNSPRGLLRKREILDAARDLFAQRGYKAVSIAEIADQVGISQAGLLHHFPSKAELLLAFLEDRENRFVQQSEMEVRAGSDYFSIFIRNMKENEKTPNLIQLTAVLSTESLDVDHPGHDWFIERYDRRVMEVTDCIRHMIDESALPESATAETVARWLIGLADGLRIQWLYNPKAMTRHETLQQFIELLDPYLFPEYRSAIRCAKAKQSSQAGGNPESMPGTTPLPTGGPRSVAGSKTSMA